MADATQVPARSETNGLAIASLALGIVGIAGVPVIGAILALVFGYMAKGQIDRSAGAETGRGLAVAGIVLGWVGLALAFIFVAVLFAFAPWEMHAEHFGGALYASDASL